MYFDIITIFPDMFSAITKEGVVARAINNDILRLKLWQLRDFSDNKYCNIDDKPYGGGAGMVMQVAPIRKCIATIKQQRANSKVIYLSPQGKKLNHKLAQQLSNYNNITLLCGRYQGIDERLIEFDINLELSIGDFVLSGGEIPAMVLIDVISRQLTGTLGNEKSSNDSFSNGLLEAPIYTRPELIDNQKVPSILLSGNDAKIAQYNKQQALLNTKKKRPDLLL